MEKKKNYRLINMRMRKKKECMEVKVREWNGAILVEEESAEKMDRIF